MDIISRNYSKLKELCGISARGLYCSKSDEDIFHDTIIYVSQDEAAREMETDNEIIAHFLYRYRMIEYQVVNDNKLLMKTEYADYKKSTETYEEEQK